MKPKIKMQQNYKVHHSGFIGKPDFIHLVNIERTNEVINVNCEKKYHTGEIDVNCIGLWNIKYKYKNK